MNPIVEKAHTRETILALLTDAEVARVSTAEDKPKLIDGDDYIDLADPGTGVHQMHSDSTVSPHDTLPKSAVSETTWAKILHAVAAAK